MKNQDAGSVGQMIKKFRLAKGVTQMELAERIGVSYQQIQKYEKGASNITIHRLKQVAEALDISLNQFLGFGTNYVSEPSAAYELMPKDEQLLLRLYRKIKSKKLKEAVLKFIKQISG